MDQMVYIFRMPSASLVCSGGGGHPIRDPGSILCNVCTICPRRHSDFLEEVYCENYTGLLGHIVHPCLGLLAKWKERFLVMNQTHLVCYKLLLRSQVQFKFFFPFLFLSSKKSSQLDFFVLHENNIEEDEEFFLIKPTSATMKFWILEW